MRTRVNAIEFKCDGCEATAMVPLAEGDHPDQVAPPESWYEGTVDVPTYQGPWHAHRAGCITKAVTSVIERDAESRAAAAPSEEDE